MSRLFTPIRSIWCSAFGSFSFAEAYECRHDLVRLHPAAAFKVDKRKRNDTFLIDDISRWRGPVPTPLFQTLIAVCRCRWRASYLVATYKLVRRIRRPSHLCRSGAERHTPRDLYPQDEDVTAVRQ